jgi:hypothetical protein
MRTRSQTNKKQKDIHIETFRPEEERENIVLYMVEIDFDEASKCWMSNKTRMKNGEYKYICCEKSKAGNPCKRKSVAGCDYCKIHKNKNKTNITLTQFANTHPHILC